MASGLRKGEALSQKCELSKSYGEKTSLRFYYESSLLGQRLVSEDGATAIILSNLGHIGQVSLKKDGPNASSTGTFGAYAIVRQFVKELAIKYKLLQKLSDSSPTARKFAEAWRRDADALKPNNLPLYTEYTFLPDRQENGSFAGALTTDLKFGNLLASVVKNVPLASPPFPLVFTGSGGGQVVEISQEWWEDPYFMKTVRWEQKSIKWWAAITCDKPQTKASPAHFATITDMNNKLKEKDSEGDLSPQLTSLRDKIAVSVLLMTPLFEASESAKNSAPGLLTARVVSGLCLSSLEQIRVNLEQSTCNQRNENAEIEHAAEAAWASTNKDLSLALVKSTIVAFSPKAKDMKEFEAAVTAAYDDALNKVCKPLINEGTRALAKLKCHKP